MKYSHTSGKQQVKMLQKHQGNMYKFIFGGTKRKRKVIKRSR